MVLKEDEKEVIQVYKKEKKVIINIYDKETGKYIRMIINNHEKDNYISKKEEDNCIFYYINLS